MKVCKEQVQIQGLPLRIRERKGLVSLEGAMGHGILYPGGAQGQNVPSAIKAKLLSLRSKYVRFVMFRKVSGEMLKMQPIL